MLYDSLENPFLEEVFRANAKEMRHTRTIEILQNHLIQQDMCPKVELYSIVEVLGSINYSSSEMKIANNPHHALVNVYEV